MALFVVTLRGEAFQFVIPELELWKILRSTAIESRKPA